MGNPRTRTTKTFASLLIVARAVRYIRETQQRVMILTPTSGNKGTALRDAVLRALEAGLVGPDELCVVTAVPRGSLPKLWSSRLSEDPELRRRNPVLLYEGDEPVAVKAVAERFAEQSAAWLREAYDLNLWYTLDLDNYRVADAVRAFFELDRFPAAPGEVRVHAHAVSSAFGLLGYHLGWRVLSKIRGDRVSRHPQFFLVQHLATPDMVLSLRHGTFSPSSLPRYARNPLTGLYEQKDDDGFPYTTFDPAEEIDPTFYTREPPTSMTINRIIREHGGGGIVVSLHECLERYPQIRAALAASDLSLPPDPRRLREWSVVMVLTGVMNAIDRDLIPRDAHVVVHGSGSYGEEDFDPLDPAATWSVKTVADLRRPVEQAASA